MFRTLLATTLILAAGALTAQAADFKLTSKTIAEGAPLSAAQVFEGFGCTGGNLSPVTLSTALWVTIFCSCEVAFRNIPYVQVVGVFRSGGDTLHGMLYDLGSLWLVSIPAALLAAYVFHWPFTAVVAAAYLGEDIPKCLLCLRHFFSMRWLKPVTPEGRAGLDAYRAEEAD